MVQPEDPVPSRSNKDNPVSIEDAIGLVEQEVQKWNCSNYMHITRAVNEQMLAPVLGQEQDSEAKPKTILELETIFSKPTQETPVPISVVCVYFFLDLQTGGLTYQFEQENVQHRVGGQSLAYGKFESWLDRIIGDKMQVRQLHDLATPFESTRLAPPVQSSEPGSDTEAYELRHRLQSEDMRSEDMRRSETDQPEMERSRTKETVYTEGSKESKDKHEDLLPMGTLLANIFDAADEDEELELMHKEVADLLYATPLGLADWDIKLLLTTAQELDTGKIHYKPFVQKAPEIIDALLRRRAAYESRDQPKAQISHEAIDLCYGEEIEEIARAAREAFAGVDTGGKGTLTRHEFRSCLLSRSERFSLQEVQLLMQMCKEDDFGQVPYDDFSDECKQLRIDSLHNALVETDVESLRIHLILLLRREGLQSDAVMPVWTLRNVLLNADQLCLSRMQIHVILSIVHPSEVGEVDVEYFLRVVCTVIPWMFDAALFMEKATAIQKEKADALAKAELEELQGLTSSLATKRRADEDEGEDVAANAPDRDAVEKALIHNASQYDEKHRQQPTLHVRKFLEAMHHESVQQCQLSDAELRGFIAEADIDEREEIGYVEHIKMWVPIIFELRKSRVYDGILARDWGNDASFLVDLSEYEGRFPLILTGEELERNSRRRPSQSSRKLDRRMSSKGRNSISRTSTKENVELAELLKSKAKKGKHRRHSKQDKDGDRPASRSRRRPASRSGSIRSLNRTNSSDSVSSHASGHSAASVTSRTSMVSRSSRR